MAQAISSHGNEIHDADIAEQNLPSFRDTNLAQKFYERHYAPGFGKKVVLIQFSIHTYIQAWFLCHPSSLQSVTVIKSRVL